MNRQKTSTTAQKTAEEQSTHRANRGDEHKPSLVPGQFSFVCESLDGKLCLFEDADGHLAVVRTDRLV
ncbi:MAG: hypothetical protein IJI68_02595 [Eggerthellaceae bacterium]|nr:hypothetical protein [Eggerthellaceae bacterium]